MQDARHLNGDNFYSGYKIYILLKRDIGMLLITTEFKNYVEEEEYI